MPEPNPAHDVAIAALVPGEHRAAYEQRVGSLLARNRLLEVIERAREAERISKKELAERAGLDPSSVRRMLTAETANPTAENAFRLLAALNVRLEAVLPTGDRFSLA